MRICLMVEGQEDVTSPECVALAGAAALAASTDRIRLGTMVSPTTFRHPSAPAKMATTVDRVSWGRVERRIGAGWHKPEHTAYGFDVPAVSPRLEVLEEPVEIVHRSWSEDPFDFSSRHDRVQGLDGRPRRRQQPTSARRAGDR